jgi:hypothetical protein
MERTRLFANNARKCGVEQDPAINEEKRRMQASKNSFSDDAELPKIQSGGES